MQMTLFEPFASVESQSYLTEQLLTYIGNKRRLLPMIERAIAASIPDERKGQASFADVFAGTGIVSRVARRYCEKIYVNDIEHYSFLSNEVYHANKSRVPLQEVEVWRQRVNELAANSPAPGFITELYAPRDEERITADDRVFYTRRNAIFIDTARSAINEAPDHIRPFLLAPLVQRASVHVNTAGVFKGFYKNRRGVGQFGGESKNALQRICAPISIPLPVFSNFEVAAIVSQLEAREFIRCLDRVDVAYFDPPYNQHPYGSNYFMLNLIIANERPSSISRVSGIPHDWTRSKYNVRDAAAPALFQLLEDTPADTLLVSYNSEGFINFEQMLDGLTRLGEVAVYDQEYNTFRGSRNLSERSRHVTEYLFRVSRT